MISLGRFITPPCQCGYLSEETWRLEYVIVQSISLEEYSQCLLRGWRRFGHELFRPRCPECSACRSLRVEVSAFRPSRSQRRNRQCNEGAVELRVGSPQVDAARLELYDRFHAYQNKAKGWPRRPRKDAESYIETFVRNPIPTEEWTYWLRDRLVGVGYVDALPIGLSAIYFFHDPLERSRGLGIWNVLSCIEQARQRNLPHVYLGYYVAGCQSLEYKANFRPNEILDAQGHWKPFRLVENTS